MITTNIAIIGLSIISIILLIFCLYISKQKLNLEKNNDYLNTSLTKVIEEKLQIERLKNNHESNYNLTHKRYLESQNNLDILNNTINKVKLNPLKYLHFKLENGEIANTVKVKTLTKNNKIISNAATVRKRIDNKYKDIKVTPVFTIN